MKDGEIGVVTVSNIPVTLSPASVKADTIDWQLSRFTFTPRVRPADILQIDFEIEGDVIRVDRDELVRALCMDIPGFAEKYAAAKLVAGRI